MRFTQKVRALNTRSLALVFAVAFLALVPSTEALAGHGGHGGGWGHGGPRITIGWGVGWGWGPYWGWGGPYYGYYGGPVVYGSPRPDARRYAVVDTDISPESAELYLNGRYIGTADDFDGYPDFLYLKPGTYDLEFRHPAYEPLKITLRAERGQKYNLDQEMKLLPGRGKLDHFDPPDRGTPLGRVLGPDGPTSAPPPPAEERDWSQSDLPKPRVDLRKEASEQGRIRWKIQPEDATVYLDDRYAGEGYELTMSRPILTKPGKHSVTVVRPGHKSKTIEFEARPGEIVDVTVELEKAN